MTSRVQQEKKFLLELAVRKFNSQFNKRFTIDQFSIKSISKNVNAFRSYEIKTKRQDDFLVLHLHLKITSVDSIQNYRLENSGSAVQGDLGDERYVTEGTVDNYYIQNGIYKFNPIAEEGPVSGNTILLEDGTDLLMEDGTPFLLEAST